MSKQIFEQAVIGGIEVRNRIVRSATFEGRADNEGRVTPAMKEIYRDLSKGGVGLIITGYMGLSASDNFAPGTITAGTDEAAGSLTELAQTVHESGCKIMAQISHVGSQLTSAPSQTVLAPSDVIDPINGIKPTPFTRDQVQVLVKEFAQAALGLKNSGFDGVQLHGAHGYLLSKFLSPVFNKRRDEYGGCPKNNVRIIVEIIEAVKKECGKDFPVWIKLNSSDFGREENAYDVDGFLTTARAVAAAGIDAIELSGGTMTGLHSPCRPKSHQAYHLEYAQRLALEVDIPIVLVGGFRSLDLIETALGKKNIQAVSLSRPLIREPGLVNRWSEGDRSDAACVACNGCFNPKGTRCYFDLEKEEQKAQKEIMKLMKSMQGKAS
jgi:2,4-dienoyl-CoA reductase-like NADH-dependent reductase (Old Yellow Enzyme family)